MSVKRRAAAASPAQKQYPFELRAHADGTYSFQMEATGVDRIATDATFKGTLISEVASEYTKRAEAEDPLAKAEGLARFYESNPTMKLYICRDNSCAAGRSRLAHGLSLIQHFGIGAVLQEKMNQLAAEKK